MGADVMRWQYCAQPPDRNLLFGFGPAHEIKRQAAHVLELGQVPRRLRQHRGLRAVVGRSSSRTASCAPLDRWLVERTKQLVAEATAAYEATLTVDVDRARSRRSSTTSRTGTSAARAAASTRSTRPRSARSGTRSCSRCASIAPVMPFLADHLWRNLVAGRAGVGAPRAVARAGRAGPRAARRDRRGAPRRRARPAGAVGVAAEAAPAAAAARRRGRSSARARRMPTRSPTSCA